MAVQYTIICDDCGGFIASSRMSVRAARARGCDYEANPGPDGDHCLACRKKAIADANLPMKEQTMQGWHFKPYG